MCGWRGDEEVKELWERLLKDQLNLKVQLRKYLEELEYQDKYGGLFIEIKWKEPTWKSRLKRWLRSLSDYPVQ